MHKHIAIFILTIITTNLVFAQESNTTQTLGFGDKLVRNLLIKNELPAIKNSPSSISLWSQSDFAYINIDGNDLRGDFKPIDDFAQGNTLNIFTESILRMPDKDWTFYGKLGYTVESYQDAQYNMSFFQSYIGSPFRLVTPRSGDWINKVYLLSGTMNKKITEKLQLGLTFDYNGGTYARILDSRNEQRVLDMHFGAGISYQFKDNHFLNFDATIRNMKMQPQFSNKFKTNGKEYYIYSLNGLGDFNQENLEYKGIITDQSPKLSLSYATTKQNKLRIQYTAIPGNELWNKQITSIQENATPDKQYKYSYFKNDINASWLVQKEEQTTYINTKAYSILGNGYEYRSDAYQRTYLFENFGGEASASVIAPHRKLFYKNKLSLSTDYSRKKDMTYAQEIAVLYASVQIETGFQQRINSSNRVCLDLNVGYTPTLYYKHDPAAAKSKSYTLEMGYNLVAYQTANIVNAGSTLSWFTQIRNIESEFKLNYSLMLPTNIKIQNEYSNLEESSTRGHIYAHMRFFF